MKRLINKSGTGEFSVYLKGEALMESIVSLLLFALLMVTIATIVIAALNMTGSTVKNANSSQSAANDALLDKYTTPALQKLTLKSGSEINVEIDIDMHGGDGFSAFAPSETN